MPCSRFDLRDPLDELDDESFTGRVGFFKI